MKIIWQHGGLGNQLFAIALYLKLKTLGYEVYLDKSQFNKHNVHDGFIADSLFDIGIDFAKERDVNYLKYGIKTENKHLVSILSRFPQRGRIFLKMSKEYSQYKSGSYYTYDKSIFSMDDKYLVGHWQNPIYFSDIKPLLLEKLTFKHQLIESLDYSKKNLLKEISEPKSVCVHVRGSDFIGTIHETVDYSYYLNAISLISNKVSDLKFYFFSDDHILLNNILNKLLVLKFNYSVVEKGNTFDDFILMSFANHYIIPNSTFSWWAAYLSKKIDKKVIIPKFWTKDDLSASISIKDEGWITL